MEEKRSYKKLDDGRLQETIHITNQPVAVPYGQQSIKVGMQESTTINFFDADKGDVIKVLMKNQIDSLAAEVSGTELKLMSVLECSNDETIEVMMVKIGEMSNSLNELNSNVVKLDKRKKESKIIQELSGLIQRTEKTRNEVLTIATLSKNLQLHKEMLARKEKEYSDFCAILL